MASAGTLLQDLDSSSGGDGDLVQKILADMNIPTSGGQRPIPPALPAQTPMYQQQMANTNTGMTMDSQIPTSHMIGNDHPTPADFAAAMTGAASVRPTDSASFASMPAAAAPVTVMPPPSNWQLPSEPTKNFYGRVLDEAKVPLVVAILFFVFSLTPIRILVAHYVPRLIKPTGEFTLLGLVAVAGIVGAFFWILQRVIAPLLSL